ncbi:hypothetical protein CORC01_02726, partial [Colletotrichum orchidophilum]
SPTVSSQHYSVSTVAPCSYPSLRPLGRHRCQNLELNWLGLAHRSLTWLPSGAIAPRALLAALRPTANNSTGVKQHPVTRALLGLSLTLPLHCPQCGLTLSGQAQSQTQPRRPRHTPKTESTYAPTSKTSLDCSASTSLKHTTPQLLVPPSQNTSHNNMS